MKNQYFGDQNDYRKYGLLRVLQSASGCRMLVAWMLTPNDNKRDGGKRGYLKRPDKWRHFDPELFDVLEEPLRPKTKPQVLLFERSGLLPWTRFFSEPVSDGRAKRAEWRQALMESASNVDLVFVDPDNGIEIPSKPVGRKGSSKYVAWREVEDLWAASRSVLIYQHFPRKPRDSFIADVVSKLRRWTGARSVYAFRTAHVVFLLAAQTKHAEGLRRAVSAVATRWNGQIVVVPD